MTLTDEQRAILAADMNRTVGDNARELRGLMDDIQEREAAIDAFNVRVKQLKLWASTYGNKHDMDQIRVPGVLTISLKEEQSVQFEDWEAFVQSLIGVHAPDGEGVQAIKSAIQMGDWGGAVEAIREHCIDFGNLHLIQRRVTASRAVDAVVEGAVFGGGFKLEPYTKVMTRRLQKENGDGEEN